MNFAHRIEAVLAEDGKLSLERLPFRAGQSVEIIMLSAPTPVEPDFDLHGSVIRFDRPTEPVAAEDWDVLK